VSVTRADEPLTYGSYLRIPELLDLQTPLAEPSVHDEMLFILGQQAQELWFKQILHDLHLVIADLERGALLDAVRLLRRAIQILAVLSGESEVLETIPLREFHGFRGYLRAASGLQSTQFRELEIASGLRDEAYLRMVGKLLDLPAVLDRWPVSLHDGLVKALDSVAPDPTRALMALYRDPDEWPQLYLLAEALSDYELRFQAWRFHHVQLVERIIGDQAPGTGGSPGSTYLSRTLGYRFFPELWEARNRLTERGAS